VIFKNGLTSNKCKFTVKYY